MASWTIFAFSAERGGESSNVTIGMNFVKEWVGFDVSRYVDVDGVSGAII